MLLLLQLLLLLLSLLLLQPQLLLSLLLGAATHSVAVAAMVGAARYACSCVPHMFCVDRFSGMSPPGTAKARCFSMSSSICSC